MKKRILAVLLTATLSLTLVACGSEKNNNSDTSENQIEVDKNLFSVELTVPAEFMEGTTQEELDKIVEEEDGYKSITLNADGSATYVMTKSQHKEMMEEITSDINTTLDEMIGSEDYPNVTKVEANSDFTSFTVTTTSTELDLNESFSVMVFYMYGGMYNIFNGTEVDNIHVDFVNDDTGEIISSSDSKDMNDADTSSTGSATYSETDGIIDFESETFKVTYTRYEIGKDYDGNPCLFFYYNFTNNSEENASAMSATYVQCFQNGVQCDTAYADYNTEMDNYMKDVQPGTTIEVCEAFALSDASDVTIEVSDWSSFSDDKDVQKLTLE